MKISIVFLACVILCLAACQPSERADSMPVDSLTIILDSKRILLPSGWSLSPAGRSLPLGDFPMNIVVSSTGKYMAITNNGQSKQTLILVDPVKEAILHEIEIPKSWYGLTFSKDEQKLYASGGNDNRIRIYNITNNQLIQSDSIVLGKPWPVRISPTGIAIDDEKGRLYIATKEDSALYVAELSTKKTKKIQVGSEAFTCLLSPDKKTLYISLWGASKVGVFDTETQKMKTTILVGSHPNDMVLTKDGKYLFVANANENTVSVVDTEANKVMEVFSSAVFPESLVGSTPNGLALSENEDRLYIANADNNCVSVFDVKEKGRGKSMGFIPTDWYPTSLKVYDDKIWITNGKGGQSLPNSKGPNPYQKRTDSTEYIGSLFKGTLTIVDAPSEETLRAYSAAVYKNTPYNKDIEKLADGQEGNPIPRKKGDVSPIKYVFYVIKENRTYDQMFGDITKGNGDSSLCLFPLKVTPNHHAMAEQFVLLDNFYVNAEVSADGHNWSMAAYANDYVEKNWPTGYGGRGGDYDYEGSRDIAWPKDGFIWDYCQRAGVSYRSYGEFVQSGKEPQKIKALDGHFDPDFPQYDLNVPDVMRFEKWKRDFDSLLSINAVPQLSTIRLPNDHTAGARVGMPTPRAMVAENDLALGMIIEHISKSKIWNEAAVFVLEDDAQNGPDHVDAHRSIALVVSPYAKRNTVVSRMYSTASMLRTMELILGLPPMSQFDAAATPMWECFTPAPDTKPYTGLAASYNIKEMNIERSTISELSSSFNLEVMDAAPDLAFSEVIWKAVKGLNSEMPAPVRSAFVIPTEEEEDDD